MSSSRPIVIFDWDCTLAEPSDRSFYQNHNLVTANVLRRQFNLSDETFDDIQNDLAARGIRSEKLLSSKSLISEFNLPASQLGNYAPLKDAIENIDPVGWFHNDPDLVKAVRALQPDFDCVVLSNSPERLIRRIGAIIGFDMDGDFAGLHCFTSEDGQPKYVDAEKAFTDIIDKYSPDIGTSWSIGDNPSTDLTPAQKMGMRTALADNLSHHCASGYTLQGPTQTLLENIRL